jgi:hypothetical protein
MWPVVVYSNKLRLKEDDGSNNEKRNGMIEAGREEE